MHQCEQQREIEAKNYLAQIAAVTDAVMLQMQSTNDSDLKISSSKKQSTPSFQNLSKYAQLKKQSFVSNRSFGRGEGGEEQKEEEGIKQNKSINSSSYSKSKSKIQTNSPDTQTHKLDSFQLDSSYPNKHLTTISKSIMNTYQTDFYTKSSNLESSLCNSNNYNNYYGIGNNINDFQKSCLDKNNLAHCHQYTNDFYVTCASNLSTNNSRLKSSFYPNMMPISSTIGSSLNFLQSSSTNLFNPPTGPNESQSTSSPPFRSTPEESELENSPLFVKPGISSNNLSDLCSSIIDHQSGLKSKTDLFSIGHPNLSYKNQFNYDYQTAKYYSFQNTNFKPIEWSPYVQSSPIKSNLHYFNNYSNNESQTQPQQLSIGNRQDEQQQQQMEQTKSPWMSLIRPTDFNSNYTWNSQYNHTFNYLGNFSQQHSNEIITNHSTDL